MTNVFQPSVFQPNVFQVGTLDVATPRRKELRIGVGKSPYSATGGVVTTQPAASAGAGGTDTIPNCFNGFARSGQSADWASVAEGYGLLTRSGISYYPAFGTQLSGGTHLVYQMFLRFDTSSIPDNNAVSAVQLVLPFQFRVGTSDVIEVWGIDWGPTLTDGEWLAKSQMGSYTILHSESVSLAAQVTLTGGADFCAAINTSGYTGLVLTTQRQRTGSAPAADGPRFQTADATSFGSIYGPRLIVTHAPAVLPASSFAVSRDSAGILIAVRDNAAPQFAVSRDSGGIMIGAQ